MVGFPRTGLGLRQREKLLSILLTAEDDEPLPAVDTRAFRSEVERRVAQLPKVWDPLTRKMQPIARPSNSVAGVYLYICVVCWVTERERMCGALCVLCGGYVYVCIYVVCCVLGMRGAFLLVGVAQVGDELCLKGYFSVDSHCTMPLLE